MKLLFNFEDLTGDKNKVVKAVSRYFNQAGAAVVTVDVDPKAKRASGISYREIRFAFADSQTIAMRVKSTGDVFEVLLNGSVVPIKYQDDHVRAIAEIAGMMDKGRAKFQAKLAKAAVKPPPGIRTTAPKLVVALTQKRDALKEAIAAVDEEIAAIGGAVA